jgi:hypothetical protein
MGVTISSTANEIVMPRAAQSCSGLMVLMGTMPTSDRCRPIEATSAEITAGPLRGEEMRAPCERTSCLTRAARRKMSRPAAIKVPLNVKPENSITVPSWLK